MNKPAGKSFNHLLLIGLFICTFSLTVSFLQDNQASAWSVDYPSEPTGGVLVIGDSHTVASEGYYPESWEVDAEIGRNSSEAFSVLQMTLERDHDVLLFDIATNDYYNAPLLESNLHQVMQIIGDRKLVLVNSQIGCAEPNQAEAVNYVLKDFSNQLSEQVRLIDWAKFISQRSELMASDCIHFTPEGYQKRVTRIKPVVLHQLNQTG